MSVWEVFAHIPGTTGTLYMHVAAIFDPSYIAENRY